MLHARLAVILALAGCGRIGFDERGDGSVAPNDVPEPFVAPMGRFDTAFGLGGQLIVGTGETERAQDVVRRPGGGYLVAGFRSVGTATTFELIAFTEQGALDLSYGNGGFAEHSINNDDFGYGLAMRPDGTTIVVGDGGTTGVDEIVTTVVDARGALVSSYGSNGHRTVSSGAGSSDTSRRVVQAGDIAYVCGTIRYDQPSSEVALVALDLAGNGVPAFDTDGVSFDPLNAQNNECGDVMVDRAGRIVIAGEAGTGAVIARYDTAGQRDPSYNTVGFQLPAPSGRLFGIAQLPNDNVIAVGDRGTEGIVVQTTPAGAPAGYPAGVLFIIGVPLVDVVIQPDGNIVVVGERDPSGSQRDIVVMRFTPDGMFDPTFDGDGQLQIDVTIDDHVRAVHQDPDGKLVLVGYVRQGAFDKPWIARLE